MGEGSGGGVAVEFEGKTVPQAANMKIRRAGIIFIFMPFITLMYFIWFHSYRLNVLRTNPCNLPCDKVPTSLAKTFLERFLIVRIIQV
jgi:hypothetical protein